MGLLLFYLCASFQASFYFVFPFIYSFFFVVFLLLLFVKLCCEKSLKAQGRHNRTWASCVCLFGRFLFRFVLFFIYIFWGIWVFVCLTSSWALFW